MIEKESLPYSRGGSATFDCGLPESALQGNTTRTLADSSIRQTHTTLYHSIDISISLLLIRSAYRKVLEIWGPYQWLSSSF